ncbi:hypothetical protein FB451DRAFT_1245466 [Mycena latifolia]|nr:hypothetical protein FB451DRAFT_1245466 [Mycena latifolia]
MRLETFLYPDFPIELPSTFAKLADLRLPQFICRETSIPPSALEANFSSVSWTFPDDALQADIMSRFQQWVEQHNNPTIPPSLQPLWAAILDHIETDAYDDESWVVDLSTDIFRLASELIKAAASSMYVASTVPASQGWVARTPHILERTRFSPERVSGVPHELTKSTVFSGCLHSYIEGVNLISQNCDLYGPDAIFAKLDLHRHSFMTDPRSLRADYQPVDCRYGAVFCGTDVILVEWVEAPDGTTVIRHSPILRTAGRKATASYIALLIGMLLPASEADYPPPQYDSKPWMELKHAMDLQRAMANPPPWMLPCSPPPRNADEDADGSTGTKRTAGDMEGTGEGSAAKRARTEQSLGATLKAASRVVRVCSWVGTAHGQLHRRSRTRGGPRRRGVSSWPWRRRRRSWARPS